LYHPNIIKIVRHYSSIGLQEMLVTPWMEKGNLFDAQKYLKDNPQQLCKVVYQMAQALSYMHANNVLHLDLKPQNIMLDENYNVVIADFGLSHTKKTTASQASVVGFQGTLEFMRKYSFSTCTYNSHFAYTHVTTNSS